MKKEVARKCIFTFQGEKFFSQIEFTITAPKDLLLYNVGLRRPHCPLCASGLPLYINLNYLWKSH